MSPPGDDARAPPSVRWFAALLGGVTLLALVLRARGLATAVLLSDDLYSAASAVSFVERGHIGPTMWHHPHLRDLLVYAALSLGGSTKVALASFSVLFGTGSVPLLGLVARRLLSSAAAGLLAALLLALDAIHIDFSRQAVHENYMAFFTLLGVWLVLRYRERRGPAWLVAAGIAFGLGVASKWVVAFPLAAVWGWQALEAFRARRAGGDGALWRLGFESSALLVLPAAIYVAVFAPWFACGHDLWDLVRLSRAMLAENLQHQGGNPYQVAVLDHRASAWFVKPIAWADFTMRGREPVVLAGFSNPIVWLPTLPAVVRLAVIGATRRRAGALAVVALFLVTYVPFLLSPRPIFANSALNVLPFAAAAVADLVCAAGRAIGHERRLVVAYAACVVVCSVPLYLLATGEWMDIPMLQDVVASLRPPPEMEGR